MSLLTLNGIEIPVATDSARLGAQVLGADVVADDGSRHRARSAYLDAITGATRLLSPAEAAAWRGLLEGRGHRCAFDTLPGSTTLNPSADPDTYTSRGLLLSGTVSRRNGYVEKTTASGNPLVNLGADSYFEQAIAIEASATNLLSSDARSASSVTPFTAIGGATRSVVTTTPVQGANCLEVVAGGVGGGVQWSASDTTVPVSTAYTASFYARCSAGTLAMEITLNSTDDGTSLTDGTLVLTTTWQRFSITLDDSTTSASQTITVEFYTHAGAGTFYLDALQIERGARASSWADGSRSGTLGLSGTLTDFRRQDDVTIAGWFYGPHYVDGIASTTDAYLWCLGDETNGVYLYRVGSNGRLRLRYITAGVTTTEIEYTTDIGNAAWHHVAVVLRRAPSSDTFAAQLFIDGTSVGTDATVMPATGSAPAFYLGRYFGSVTNPWEGYVDELLLLPYALTADMIGTIYDARFSDLPRVNVSGDYVGNVDVECLPSVTGDGLRFMYAADGGSRNATLAFQLSQAER